MGDPCFEPNPNVCGQGATCEATNHKAVCSCPRGYTGDPFVSCRRFEKKDLCTPDPCGPGANCQARNHGAICSCPSGYVGDPLTACRPARRSQANVVGFSRFRRSLNPYFLLFPEN